MSELHVQYLTAPNGDRQAIVLPIGEWESVLDRLEELEDIEDAHKILARIKSGEEDVVTWETIKAEYDL